MLKGLAIAGLRKVQLQLITTSALFSAMAIGWIGYDNIILSEHGDMGKNKSQVIMTNRSSGQSVTLDQIKI